MGKSRFAFFLSIFLTGGLWITHAYADEDPSLGAASGDPAALSGAHESIAHTIVVDALKLIGAPYRWGGSSPFRGFDCSGYVKYVLGKLDIEVPRSSYAQARALQPVARNDLKPGDLVFFNTLRRPFSHVGIYIGHQRFVSALNPRQGVVVTSLNNPYWAARYDGARRLPKGGSEELEGVADNLDG